MLVTLPFPSLHPAELSFNSVCLIDESKNIIIAILSYSYMTGKTRHVWLPTKSESALFTPPVFPTTVSEWSSFLQMISDVFRMNCTFEKMFGYLW